MAQRLYGIFRAERLRHPPAVEQAMGHQLATLGGGCSMAKFTYPGALILTFGPVSGAHSTRPSRRSTGGAGERVRATLANATTRAFGTADRLSPAGTSTSVNLPRRANCARSSPCWPVTPARFPSPE